MSDARRPSKARLAAIVLRHEMRGLLRDRRALLVGFVLPVVLYPFLFLGSERLGRASRERLDERTLQVAHDLRALPDALRERVLAALEDAEGGGVELSAVSPGEPLREPLREGEEPAPGRVRELLGAEGDAWLRAVPREDGPPLLEIHGDFAREDGAAARGRIAGALAPLREARALELLEETLGGDPARALEPEHVDVSTGEDRAGLGLGRLLPLIAVLVLVSGGSFAALDAFAGERERGTLETLLVQPVPAIAVAWGKYAAVLLAALVALAGNVASLVACVAFDVGALPGVDPAEAGALPGSGRLAFGALLFLPVAALVSAALAYVCARARSYREGQHYLMPLTLVALVPGAMAAAPEVELDVLTAVLPVAGPAIAMREALRGALSPAAFAGVLAASTAWVVLALRALGRTLDAERLLATPDDESERAQRRVQSRAALRWGFAAALLVYVVGGELQAARPLEGLLATLWILVPALALLSARGTARRSGRPVAAVLGLRRASPWHVLGAIWIAPGLAWLARALVEWQSRVLPLPGFDGALDTPAALFGTESAGLLLFALALSPAVTEELLFRGAILSGLRADLRPARCVAWQALLFALVHLSVHRLLATAALGAILATLALRARSVLPAMALHAAYNALLVSAALELELANAILESPWIAVSALGVVFLARRPPRH